MAKSKVAEAEAALAAARQDEVDNPPEPEPVSLKTLDARLTEVERRLHGGATE